MWERRWSSEDRRQEASADIVVGLGWGDEGKGATVDALVASRPTARVVRFNGGQQAGHNVIVNGVHHTFASFGSGSFSGVDTWISSFCTVDPRAIINESIALKKKGVKAQLFVDGECLVTTPLHIAANVARDSVNGHGTTGTGFGETVYYGIEHSPLRVKHLYTTGVIMKYLRAIHDFYYQKDLIDPISDLDLYKMAQDIHEAYHYMIIVTSSMLIDNLRVGHTVFEGAQGFVLDETFGHYPHVTWSTTTPANAKRLLRIAGVDNVRTIGCLRTYATRHGNGPLPLENKLPFRPKELHNAGDGIQGSFRVATHDLDVVNWAVDTTNVDCLSIGHLDIFDGMMTNHGLMHLDDLPRPVIMKSYGPQRKDRILV